MGALTAKIGKDTFTIRELTLREIRDLTDNAGGNSLDALTKLLTISTTAKPENIIDSSPSELTEFVEKMVEVNTPFLEMTRAIKSEDLGESLMHLIRSIFLMSFTSSSKEDTQVSGNTPTQDS